jgi:hypothetical protein
MSRATPEAAPTPSRETLLAAIEDARREVERRRGHGSFCVGLHCTCGYSRALAAWGAALAEAAVLS